MSWLCTRQMLQEMGGIQNNNSKAHFSKKWDKSARIQKTKTRFRDETRHTKCNDCDANQLRVHVHRPPIGWKTAKWVPPHLCCNKTSVLAKFHAQSVNTSVWCMRTPCLARLTGCLEFLRTWESDFLRTTQVRAEAPPQSRQSYEGWGIWVLGYCGVATVVAFLGF